MTTKQEQQLFEQGKFLLGKLRLYRAMLLDEKHNRKQYQVLIKETQDQITEVRKQLFENYKIIFT